MNTISKVINTLYEVRLSKEPLNNDSNNKTKCELEKLKTYSEVELPNFKVTSKGNSTVVITNRNTPGQLVLDVSGKKSEDILNYIKNGDVGSVTPEEIEFLTLMDNGDLMNVEMYINTVGKRNTDIEDIYCPKNTVT